VLDRPVRGRRVIEAEVVNRPSASVADAERAVVDGAIYIRRGCCDPVPADGVEQDELVSRVEPPDTFAGPAVDALREHRLDPEAVSWLQTNFLITELELGHCLRTLAEGPCECDLVLTCSKSSPQHHDCARLDVERQLIDDATTRGWEREVERHTATKYRIEQLLAELGR
jgi:hypothetical protein